jgi:bifunctional DNase/RNase
MGVTTQASARIPYVLFREKKGHAVLPVEVNSIDAAIAIAEMDRDLSSPHDIALDILEKAGARLDRCLFIQGIDSRRYLELHFKGAKRIKPMRVASSLVMSFCLRSRARFFCTREFLDSVRDSYLDPRNRWSESALDSVQRPRYLN